MPMSVSWEMLCMEMACCSSAKTRWKLRGLSSIPYSPIKQSCIHMNQVHGDLVRRTIWLSTWAAGTIPKKIEREHMIRRLRKKRTKVVASNYNGHDSLQTIMPTVSGCSYNQPQISECPWL